MRKLFLIISSVILGLVSCSDRVSYAELQEREQDNIQNFIDKNKIEVVRVMPKEDEWKENIYYKSETGLYYHLVQKGDKEIQATDNSIVSIRYVANKIDKYNKEILRNWDAQDFIYPEMIKIGDLSYNKGFGQGVNEALGYMKNYQSEAIILVESRLNTSSYKNSVTPVRYRLKITAIR